ncbi:facilitated trehalose transporter Tret1-like isoform X2 [Adelges cooleyi]|nr:facilitated trehalose transporter Tret1-like isoform X2 [Adelges cooleyi]XP_050436246.1 facilitated trehalose transporter Tret1-like isoform X2 [Adelges cooleyi]XP_050436255.1 facilitated trehalose transporter Tret1-like isoform X2 [Adelges cooleyi]
MGFSGVMIAQLREPNSEIPITGEQASWIASSVFLTCPLGSVIFGVIMDKYGRLRSMQLSMYPLIVCFAWIWLASSITDFYLARFIVGLAVGSGSSAICLYICETCSTESRSFFLSLFNINQAVGMILSTTLMQWMSWRSASEVFLAACVALTILLYIVPESPGWLLSKGRSEESDRICRWFGLPPLELSTEQCGRSHAITLKSFTSPEVWKPAVLCMTFFVLQNATGFTASFVYLVDFTRECRVPFDAVQASAFLSLARLIGASLNSFVFYNVPRKTLTCMSGLGMAASAAVIAATLRTYDDPSDSPTPWLTFVCLIMYIISAMMGVSSQPFTFCAEVFPTAISGVMMGITTSLAYVLMFSYTKIFPLVIIEYGMELYLWVCTCAGVAVWLFGWFLLPETKNKTKKEITEYFSSKSTKP